MSFPVGDGEHVALVGAIGAGKTTIMRIIAGTEKAREGTVSIVRSLGVMTQLVGSIDDTTTVRDLYLSLANPALQDAAERLQRAEARLVTGEDDGMKYAGALKCWESAGGYDTEVVWEESAHRVLGLGWAEVSDRPMSTFSSGEQKRLALEFLLRGEHDVLLLDEPDNFLDVPGKEWLTERINDCPKTILYVSHDRGLLADTSHKVVTIEAKGSWTHGGSFTTWAEAREARIEAINEEQRRWSEERKRLVAHMKERKQRASEVDSSKLARQARAAETKLRQFDEKGAPQETAKDQQIDMRLERGRTGKSHFLRLLGGCDVAHEGTWRLGARVEAGHFNQTHDHPELAGLAVLEILAQRYLDRGQAMSRLRRYELQNKADQPFETLSGGQQARLQILLLEIDGANLLLLDEPTDNLDVASAQALEAGLEAFAGTVICVTHDRWFLKGFDHFNAFTEDHEVVEIDDPSMAWTQRR